MAPDFRKLAEDRLAASKDEQAKEEAARRTERETKEARRDSDVSALIAAVQSHIEDAKREFAKLKIGLAKDESFDTASYTAYTMPHIRIRLLSPPRRSDGYRAESPSLFFQSDGKQLVTSFADSFARRPERELGKAPLGQHEHLVEQGFSKLLDGYFTMLKQLPYYPEQYQT